MADPTVPPAPAGGGRRLYVYFKVDPEHLQDTLAQVRRHQARLLAACPGLQIELLRRPAGGERQVTLMEVYAECTPGAMPETFGSMVEAAAADLPQPRHLEWFVPA